MPQHTEAAPDLLGSQIVASTLSLPGLVARVENIVTMLTYDTVTGHEYEVEHLDEHLEWLAAELTATAARLESVRKYTRVGAARENRKAETIRVTTEQHIAARDGDNLFYPKED